MSWSTTIVCMMGSICLLFWKPLCSYHMSNQGMDQSYQKENQIKRTASTSPSYLPQRRTLAGRPAGARPPARLHVLFSLDRHPILSTAQPGTMHLPLSGVWTGRHIVIVVIVVV